MREKWARRASAIDQAARILLVGYCHATVEFKIVTNIGWDLE
jgi:hypothetical protein